MKSNLSLIFIGLYSSFFISGCLQSGNNDEYLLAFNDTLNEGCGYKNQEGEIIISPGKFSLCITDTLRNFAIVYKSTLGWLGIDRRENILFEVFPFDNGPDYPSEGLFRIMENDKIGYADVTTGAIIIKPRFQCAYPFENGTARVSDECSVKSGGENRSWISEKWYFINPKGERVEKLISIE